MSVHSHDGRSEPAPGPRLARPSRRERHPNFSPTRPPIVPGDLALWPSWTEIPLEGLGLIALDERGAPLTFVGHAEGGAR